MRWRKTENIFASGFPPSLCFAGDSFSCIAISHPCTRHTVFRPSVPTAIQCWWASPMAVSMTMGRDTKWLTLEVCREFQRGTCSRSDAECKFAHPSRSCHVENGRVIACFDSLKVTMQRTSHHLVFVMLYHVCLDIFLWVHVRVGGCFCCVLYCLNTEVKMASVYVSLEHKHAYTPEFPGIFYSKNGVDVIWSSPPWSIQQRCDSTHTKPYT